MRVLRAVALVAALAVFSVTPTVGREVARPTPAAADTFGWTPLDDVLYWADVTKDCGLGRDELAAMMLAPTYPETGASGSKAPSPMTLSRYDTQAGLYAFGDPATAYAQAFWHPGVGMWQFDSAGGWNLTAATAISSWVSASQAATTIVSRFCAGGSRSYAWGPWHGCSSGKCEEIFNRIFDGSSLVGVDRDLWVSREGGMVQRTCSMTGVAGTFPCWYVDPAKAEGFAGFANPAWGRAPISRPFYVFDRDGREQRHWLKADTGYAVGVHADKPITANARTSLVWATGEIICDVDLRRGACGAGPPAPLYPLTANADGDFTPLVGDYDRNGRDDVLWYAPGPTSEVLYQSSGSTFAPVITSAISVKGTYTPLVGDFNGDLGDDILWYAPGTAPDYLWYGTSFGFLSAPVTVNGTYTPLVGDFNGDGIADISWVAAGATADPMWWGQSDRTFMKTRIDSYAPGAPVTGDFDGDGADDVVWYTTDGTTETVWFGGPSRTFVTSASAGVSGSVRPYVGDFDGDGRSDIVWYAPGAAVDAVWWGSAGRAFATALLSVNNTYDHVLTGDFDGSGTDDLFWLRKSAEPDYIHWGQAGRSFRSVGTSVAGAFRPFTGEFFAGSGRDIYLYQPGAAPDVVWTAG